MQNAPYSVDIDIYGDCNLNCIHCNKKSISHRGGLITARILELVDEIYEFGVARILLSGGEPTLRKDWLSVVTYVCNKIGLNTTLVTNGTIWHNEEIDELSNLQEPPQIVISLDGHNPDVYGRVRRYKNGQPAHIVFDHVVKTASRCVSRRLNLSINIVVTETNANYIDNIVNLAGNLGASSILIIKCSELDPKPESDVCCRASTWQSTLSQITYFKEIGRKYYNNVQMLTSCPWEMVIPLQKEGYRIDQIFEIWSLSTFCCNSESTSRNSIGCSDGISHCSIDFNGNVLPCSIVPVSDISLIAGNVAGKKFQNIWQDSNLLGKFRGLEKNKLIGKCFDCAEFGWCRGGCRIRSIILGDGIFSDDPSCPFNN